MENGDVQCFLTWRTVSGIKGCFTQDSSLSIWRGLFPEFCVDLNVPFVQKDGTVNILTLEFPE